MSESSEQFNPTIPKFSEEPCWLNSWCPCRNAACRCTQPEDDGCYIYRRFKEIFNKQGLLKSP